MIDERKFEEKFYTLFGSKLENNPFKESWSEFLNCIREQLHYDAQLNQIERNILWQAGASFKTGCELIEQKKIHNCTLSENVIEIGGIQLIIFGTFLQLKEWVSKLRVENKDVKLVGKIKKYIAENENLQEFRNAISHSGDNQNKTYFSLAPNDQIKFQTRKTDIEITINLYEVLFSSLLLWIVFSEWANNKIEN